MSIYEKISKKLGFKTKMSSTLKLYLCVDVFISILPFLFIDTKTGKGLVAVALWAVMRPNTVAAHVADQMP